MKNAIIYLLVFIAIQFGVTMSVRELWRLATGSTDVTTMMLVVSMAAFSIVTVAIFLLARWGRMSASYIRLRPWTVLMWCVVAAVGAVIPSIWLQEQMPELPDLMADQLGMILKDRWGYVAVGLLVPLAEELVFRGAILRSLLKWNSRHWVAIAISALLFALVHGNPAQMPHAFLVGLLLGWMYYRTGSIVPGVAYHWANNTVAYVIYNVLPNPEAPLIVLFNGSGRAVMMSVLFSLCMLVPAIYQLALWLRRP